MNTFDKILTNFGLDNDGLGPFWSPLERVAHKFHLWDVWVTVKGVYESKVLPNLLRMMFVTVSWITEQWNLHGP